MFGRRTGDTIGSVARWTPPLDDLTPLTPERRGLGYAAFAILAPLPHALWSVVGLHCPYL